MMSEARLFSWPRVAVCPLLAVVLLSFVSPANADPDWNTVSYTLIKDMQAVDGSGNGTWTVPQVSYEQAYKLYGVVLNDPEDMLDTTPNDSLTGMWQLGGQWQVFVQTTLPNDFGGTALWMGQNYGNTSFH